MIKTTVERLHVAESLYTVVNYGYNNMASFRELTLVNVWKLITLSSAGLVLGLNVVMVRNYRLKCALGLGLKIGSVGY